MDEGVAATQPRAARRGDRALRQGPRPRAAVRCGARRWSTAYVERAKELERRTSRTTRWRCYARRCGSTRRARRARRSSRRRSPTSRASPHRREGRRTSSSLQKAIELDPANERAQRGARLARGQERIERQKSRCTAMWRRAAWVSRCLRCCSSRGASPTRVAGLRGRPRETTHLDRPSSGGAAFPAPARIAAANQVAHLDKRKHGHLTVTAIVSPFRTRERRPVPRSVVPGFVAGAFYSFDRGLAGARRRGRAPAQADAAVGSARPSPADRLRGRGGLVDRPGRRR